MRWTDSRFADLIPLLAFLVVMGGVALLDHERAGRAGSEERQAARVAERRAFTLADQLGNAVSERIGNLTAAELQFSALEDSVSERTLLAVIDSVTRRTAGLMAISVVYPATGRVLTQESSILRNRLIGEQDTAIVRAYERARQLRQAAATGVLEDDLGRRVLVFRPLERTDTLLGVIVAELEPHMVYRAAYELARLDTIPQGFQYWVHGPNNAFITARQARPEGWKTVSARVRVADTEWTVVTAYQPPNLQVHRAERLAIWVAGTALALAISLILLFLRRTIRTQNDEIARRQVAEETARTAAAEARERAREARDLAAQLEAAQRASQRLSTSLDPDGVVELFLGGVAEILDADVASLYTFEEAGALVVGRKRMVFRDVSGVTERLAGEDITRIRAPVSLLPHLAEPVATGEPWVQADRNSPAAAASSGGEPNARVSVPLMIAGHTVGVATWEVFSGPASFSEASIRFAQALAAPAAAALRTAELFASLEAERLRTASEALRFAAVLDQMADGVVVVDAQGRVERTNESAEELLGEGLAGAPVAQWPERYDLVGSEGRPMKPAEFPLARAIRGERVRRSDFIIRNPQSTERHLSSSASPILGRDGEPTGAAMVLRDVSDEHQYAEMLRHSNRELRRQAHLLEEVNRQLREATKAKDQFMAVMSHELRTPINAIMGYSDLLDLGVKGELNSEQRAMLARVRDTSHHLLGLINEVLDLAKIGSGRMELAIADLPVRAIVERAVQQVLPLAEAKALRLDVRTGPDAPDITVSADETRLTQIIINLVSNAVKFTTQGGVTVSYQEQGEHVAITVADTGTGIPPELQDRVFEEFYQVEGGLSRSSGGTGLGLSIARRFARLMGGDIRVESTLGVGSTFAVLVPRAVPDGDAADATLPMVVVLAHSDPALERLQQDLADTVDVIGTSDPKQVAGLARQERTAAVALDARAPAAGGWRALAALQSDPGTADLPRLLFAHESDDGDFALDLGVIRTLPKPLSVERARALILDARPPGESLRHVLIAESDADTRSILGEALVAAKCRVSIAEDHAALMHCLADEVPDVLVLDLLAPALCGVEVLAWLQVERRLHGVTVVALLATDLLDDDLQRLEHSAAALARGRRARAAPTAELLREALVRGGREAALSRA